MLSRSLHIGTYAGIPVKVHWSFLFILLYLAWISVSRNLGLERTITYGLTFLSLFICVILHEYGHAFAARKYGIKTRDIILSPIGGLARLESMPKGAKQEMIVAFAGPFINLGLLLILVMIKFVFAGKIYEPFTVEDINYVAHPSAIIHALVWINIVMFFFNLIPAYPMDGGRILKAILSLKYSKVKSLMIASSVGRVFAIGFIALGVYQKWIAFMLIGLFVYIVATKEFHFAKRYKQKANSNISSETNPT